MSFDLRVHIRDRKTGKTVKIQPYQLRIDGGKSCYVRNGVRYHADGSKFNPNDVEIVPKSEADLKLELEKEIAKVKALAAKMEAERAFNAQQKEQPQVAKTVSTEKAVQPAKATTAMAGKEKQETKVEF